MGTSLNARIYDGADHMADLSVSMDGGFLWECLERAISTTANDPWEVAGAAIANFGEGVTVGGKFLDDDYVDITLTSEIQGNGRVWKIEMTEFWTEQASAYKEFYEIP